MRTNTFKTKVDTLEETLNNPTQTRGSGEGKRGRGLTHVDTKAFLQRHDKWFKIASGKEYRIDQECRKPVVKCSLTDLLTFSQTYSVTIRLKNIPGRLYSDIFGPVA